MVCAHVDIPSLGTSLRPLIHRTLFHLQSPVQGATITMSSNHSKLNDDGKFKHLNLHVLSGFASD